LVSLSVDDRVSESDSVKAPKIPDANWEQTGAIEVIEDILDEVGPARLENYLEKQRCNGLAARLLEVRDHIKWRGMRCLHVDAA